MKKTLLILILCICCLLVQAQENFDTVKIRPVKVAENLYFLKGSGGNIGVFIGKDGTLMVDDQFAPLSEKLHQTVREALHEAGIALPGLRVVEGRG